MTEEEEKEFDRGLLAALGPDRVAKLYADAAIRRAIEAEQWRLGTSLTQLVAKGLGKNPEAVTPEDVLTVLLRDD